MAKRFILGIDCHLYFSLDPIDAPTWTEITNVGEVTTSVQKGKSDATTRAAKGWKVNVATLKDGTIDFEMVWNTEDTGFNAIADAFFNDHLISIAATDLEITDPDAQGLLADCEVFNFDRQEPKDGVTLVKISVGPGYSANAPKWMGVST